jgi:hypothetical protein
MSRMVEETKPIIAWISEQEVKNQSTTLVCLFILYNAAINALPYEIRTKCKDIAKVAGGVAYLHKQETIEISYRLPCNNGRGYTCRCLVYEEFISNGKTHQGLSFPQVMHEMTVCPK